MTGLTLEKDACAISTLGVIPQTVVDVPQCLNALIWRLKAVGCYKTTKAPCYGKHDCRPAVILLGFDGIGL